MTKNSVFIVSQGNGSEVPLSRRTASPRSQFSPSQGAGGVKIFLAILALAFFAVRSPAETGALTLAGYRASALAGNHELREAELAAKSAEETKKGAFTSYFPKVSAAAALANTDVIPGLSQPLSVLPLTKESNSASIAMLTASQPLFAGGRIVNGNKLAGTGAEAARQELRLKRNEVVSGSEKKFRQLLILNGKMRTLEAYEKLLDSLYSQVSQALERGVATKTDELRVRLKKEEISVKKSQLRKLTGVAEKDLKLYAGMETSVSVLLKEEDEAVEPPAFSTETLRDFLFARPEYKLLQAGVEAAELQKKIKQGEYLPAVSVGASFYRVDYYGHNDYSTSVPYQDVMAFAMITVPLSGWWEASHNVKEMRLKEDSARDRLASLGDYLVLDMETKLRNFETGYDKVVLAKIAVDEARANKSEAEDGYKNGTEKLSDYLEALALEQESLNRLDEARAEYFEARTAFLLAAGQMDERK